MSSSLCSLDALLDNEMFCGFESDDFVNFRLGFGAEQGSAVLQAMLDRYENIHFINDDGTLNLLPSPAYQTEVLSELGLETNGEEQILPGVHIYPAEYFNPKSYDTGLITLTEKTFSIHHFNGSWMSDEERFKADVRRRLATITRP